KFNYREEDMTWEVYRAKRKMLVLDKIFPEGVRIPEYFHGKNIVHLPTTKCHIYTTTTGAMKNAFGGLLNTNRHYTHSHIHETLVDLLAIQKEIHTGIFATMDGTTAGNGPGPRIMEPVQKNVILASGDQVAIDAVAAKMMGFDPMSVQYIRTAHAQGLVIGDPRAIEAAGDGSRKRVVSSTSSPTTWGSNNDDRSKGRQRNRTRSLRRRPHPARPRLCPRPAARARCTTRARARAPRHAVPALGAQPPRR